ALRCALEDFAHRVGMRPTQSNVADYMKKLFGQREEPWKGTTKSDVTRPFEFDGSASGIVPMTANPRSRIKVAPSSPMAMMQEIAAPTGTQMAWVSPQRETPARRSLVIG